MIKIFCSNCGQEINEKDNFCSNCGAKIESNNNTGQTSLKSNSQSFVDEIYGIKFQIPQGYETTGGVDNRGTAIITEYNRIYSNSLNSIEISVSTINSRFHWDLSKDRQFDDIDKIINGYTGVFNQSSKYFKYLDGKKLVMISGASEEQLEKIIFMKQRKRGLFG